jgi:DNA-binding CsgD family transcriptional regulator
MLPEAISLNFKLYRSNEGVKVLRKDVKPFFTFDTGITSDDLYNAPFNCYLLNRNSEIQFINKENMRYLQGLSLQDLEGRTAKDFINKDEALALIRNDRKVFYIKKPLITEEFFTITNNDKYSCISIKLPWYANNGDIVGIFGCSFSLDNSIQETLTLIHKFGLLSLKNNFPVSIGKIYFTPKETDIIKYMIRGKTAKETASFLDVSRRTIEYHIINIKNKLGVNTKSEIIDKMIDHFL